MQYKKLILLGGGGHCKSVIDVAESAGYNIIGVLDKPEEVGKHVLDYKVIGTDDDISLYVDKAEFVITVGFIKNPAIRIKLYNKVKKAGGKLATVIASTAHVSKYAILSEGTVIMHQAVVNAGANIGSNSIINTFANIEHNAQIGHQCHISTGAMVNGDCKVGDRCFIGSQSVLANGIEIGDDIIVGAGTVVCKTIITKGVYIGNPVNRMRINMFDNNNSTGGGEIRYYNLASFCNRKIA